MKRLFIGCRVRILYSRGWPELAGETGRIVGLPRTLGVSGNSEWLVAPDCWGSYKAPMKGAHGAYYFGPSSDQLEPILPDGMRPCEEGFEEWLDNMMTTASPIPLVF